MKWSRFRSRKFAWSMLATTIVLLSFLWLQYDRTVNGVHVFSDAASLRCENTAVEERTDTDTGSVMHVAHIVPGMDCRIRFLVRNDSGRDIPIKTVALSSMGPVGGPGIEATQLDIRRNGDSGPLPGEIDAIWIMDHTVASDEISDYEFTIEFRPGGCTADGGTLIFHGPRVEVGFGFINVEIEPETLDIGFVGTEHTACSS